MADVEKLKADGAGPKAAAGAASGGTDKSRESWFQRMVDAAKVPEGGLVSKEGEGGWNGGDGMGRPPAVNCWRVPLAVPPAPPPPPPAARKLAHQAGRVCGGGGRGSRATRRAQHGGGAGHKGKKKKTTLDEKKSTPR